MPAAASPRAVDVGALEHISSVMFYQNRSVSIAGHHADQYGNLDADKKPAHKENFRVSMASGRSHDKESLPVYDVRPAQGQFDIDTHGFMFANLKTAMPQTMDVLMDPDEEEIRRTFWPEVAELARRHVTSAGRRPKFAVVLGTQKFAPLTKEQQKGIKNPFGSLASTYSRIAHADFSEVVFDNAYKMLVKRGLCSEQEGKEGLDLMFVNAWKPFGQTVRDNPFAILDWTSVDAKEDVHTHLRGKHHAPGALFTSSVTYNPKHRWVYLPEQRDDEIWLFKQADSRAVNKEPASLAQYGFHQSFKLPDDPGPENRTRRSIALRLLLAFEKSGGAAASSKL